MARFSSIAISLPLLLLGACVVQGPGGYGPPVGAVAVNPEIAFGYSDGYWDRNHQWHAWQDQRQAAAWRAQNPGHYYDHRHDQDQNAGWRANDQWWSQR